MADLFVYCENCHRVSILAEVARFGVDTYPYICPACAVEENGQVKVPAGKEANQNAGRKHVKITRTFPSFRFADTTTARKKLS